MNTRSTFASSPMGKGRHAQSLPPAIDAEEGDIDIMGEGLVHYYYDREMKGRPVVLVHSVNAAASSYEMRPLFESLRRTRQVFALDLPGFGRSARDARTYTPDALRARSSASSSTWRRRRESPATSSRCRCRASSSRAPPRPAATSFTASPSSRPCGTTSRHSVVTRSVRRRSRENANGAGGTDARAQPRTELQSCQ